MRAGASLSSVIFFFSAFPSFSLLPPLPLSLSLSRSLSLALCLSFSFCSLVPSYLVLDATTLLSLSLLGTRRSTADFLNYFLAAL